MHTIIKIVVVPFRQLFAIVAVVQIFLSKIVRCVFSLSEVRISNEGKFEN